MASGPGWVATSEARSAGALGPGFTNKVEERGGVGMIFINEMKGMEVRLDFIPLDAWTPNRKLSTVRRPPQHAHTKPFFGFF